MVPDPTVCCFYEIQELTKNERVAVGSNGNILRWAPDGHDDQRWLLEPWDNQRHRIRTVSNGEFMAVGSNGNILRWAETDGDDQLFSFVNEDQNDHWFNIQEHTKNEYVAVGSNGNILRWAYSGHNDQRFKLIPSPATNRPTPATGQYDPGNIPDIPRMKVAGDPLPERSDVYLVGEMVMPATLISDSGFGSRVEQVRNNPYYFLRRERFWDRTSPHGYLIDEQRVADDVITRTIKVGISETDTQSVEETTGFKLTTSGTIGFEVGTKPKVSGSATISYEFDESLKVTTTNQQVTTEEVTIEDQIHLPAGYRMVQARWSIVDRYTLFRVNKDSGVRGDIVSQWDVAIAGTQKTDSQKVPIA